MSDLLVLGAVFTGGLLAGFINTLASNGSLLTLPMLIFFGLSPSVANATNRVGVLVQTAASSYQYWRKGRLQYPAGSIPWIITPLLLGSLLGASIAVDLSEALLNYSIAAVMVVMLLVILFNFKPEEHVHKFQPSIMTFGLFLLIGCYGGYLQAGASLLILTTLFAHGISYQIANGLKLSLVLLLTIPALAIFVWQDQVNWRLGAVLAAGQALGAVLGTKVAFINGIEKWVKNLLIVIIVASIVKLLFWR